MNEAEFRSEIEAEGYGNMRVIEFEPNSSNDMHTHDFTARAFILSGEFNLETEAGPNIQGPGGMCSLAAGTLHCEKAGADGATILLGTK